eukprot:258460_1
MARTKLKFRLHRAVIVLFCLALLVALMQGASWFSQNHQRQRNPQLEELARTLAHRKFLLGSFLLLAATLVVMACLPSGSSLTLLLFVLFSTTISAVSNLVGILPAESFPTDIRSLGVGFATAMSRLGAAVSTGLLPWVLAQWGMQVTLLLLATEE